MKEHLRKTILDRRRSKGKKDAEAVLAQCVVGSVRRVVWWSSLREVEAGGTSRGAGVRPRGPDEKESHCYVLTKEWYDMWLGHF